MRANRSALALERQRAARWFLLPAVVAVLLVAGWPLARTVWFSFTDARLDQAGAPAFVGLGNYRLLIEDPDWWNAVRNTLVFATASVVLETFLGLVIALALDQRLGEVRVEVALDLRTQRQRRHHCAQAQQRPVHVHAGVPVVAAPEDGMDRGRRRMVAFVQDQVVELVRVCAAHRAQCAFGKAVGVDSDAAQRVVSVSRWR